METMKDYQELVKSLPEELKAKLRPHYHRFDNLSESSKWKSLYYLSKTL